MEKTRRKSIFGRREIDMTQGSIPINILKFAFPLLLGNLFQQLYNMVDMWVIGQTDNVDAFAAVRPSPRTSLSVYFLLSFINKSSSYKMNPHYPSKEYNSLKWPWCCSETCINLALIS